MKKTKSTILIIFYLIFIPISLYAETLKIPLNKIAPVKSVDLKCISSGFSAGIPLPQRWKIEKATLTFDYVNSAALLPNKSFLAIKINGNTIAQVSLNPLTPEGTVKLSLPINMLEAGYNNLSFDVTQHYTIECEQACAPDLWTTLKLGEASLEIEYSLRPVPLKLSTIPEYIFDPKIFPYGQINIVLQDESPEMVTLASIAASGIARRFDYRKVLFTVSKDIQQGYDNILIGNKDFINKFLNGKGININKSITGPLLKIMHLPTIVDDKIVTDPNHALIVISGLNTDHTKLATETFAIMSTPFPDTEELLAFEFTMPDIPAYGGKLILAPDKKYTLKTLNLQTHTFRSIEPSPREITFRLPSDFLIKPNLFAELILSFSYGAALRSDSVFNISLNDKSLRGVHLDDVHGALIDRYKIEIPTYLFKSGTNVFKFEAALTPLIYGKCENIQTKNLFLTLYDVSTFYIPKMPHFTEMPKLEMFIFNGFPITRWPDGHEAMFYLTRKDNSTISAALNIIGMITQNNGYPLLDIKFTYDNPKNYNGEIIIIGDIGSIPEDIKKITPLTLTKQTTVPYPVIRSWTDEFSLIFSKQISGLGAGRGALMEFQSPSVNGRSMILVTATSSDEVLALSEILMESSVQANIAGDLNLIYLIPIKDDYRVISFNIGKKYYSGKMGILARLDYYLYTYPWIYYIAIGFVIVFLCFGSFYLLVIHRKKRLKKTE